MFFILLIVINDIAGVAGSNCASLETAIRSLRRHGVFADFGMDKLNG
jgi:hypothetical protein